MTKTVWVVVSAWGVVGVDRYPTEWDAQVAADFRNALIPTQKWIVKPLAVMC